MTEDCTRFEQVQYDSLNARQKEVILFQNIAATFADYGYNCIKLADDWQGADFLAYDMNRDATLKVQLKSRLTIDQKYSGKNIWIAFPHKKSWYLIKHDHLVEKVKKHTDALNRHYWKNRHQYHSKSINAGLLKSLAKNKLGPVYGSVLVGAA